MTMITTMVGKNEKKGNACHEIQLEEKIHFFQILMVPWDSSRAKIWFNFNRCKMLANIHKNKQLAKLFHIRRSLFYLLFSFSLN